jgi:hypothetical protein
LRYTTPRSIFMALAVGGVTHGPVNAHPLNGFCAFFLTPLRNTATKDILDRSSLRRRLTTAYGSTSTTASYYDDGSVIRRWQATAAARQRRLRLEERQTTAHRTRTTASAYRRKTTAAASTTSSAAASVSPVDRNNNQCLCDGINKNKIFSKIKKILHRPFVG